MTQIKFYITAVFFYNKKKEKKQFSMRFYINVHVKIQLKYVKAIVNNSKTDSKFSSIF